MASYSGKQVIKAGEKLIDEKIFSNAVEFESSMNILSYWRFSHETPLESAFQILQKVTLTKEKHAIFAKRLKRHASIVGKLLRFRDMKLKNMQDIGGCRAILTNKKKLIQIVRDLRKMPEFRGADGKIRYKDYIENPKMDGYRGYHLVGKFKGSDGKKKSIEIQLRTALQHDWATAIEIVDLFTGQALKSNRGQEEWKIFFSCVSEQFALMDDIHMFRSMSQQEKFKAYILKIKDYPEFDESRRVAQLWAEKLEVVRNFEAFAHSLRIVDDQIENSDIDGYVLLEVETSKAVVQSTLFRNDQNIEAEKAYIEAEKRAVGEKHTVVALVSSGAVGGIKEAYPNFFADSTDFLSHLILVINAQPRKKSMFSGLLKSFT